MFGHPWFKEIVVKNRPRKKKQVEILDKRSVFIIRLICFNRPVLLTRGQFKLVMAGQSRYK